jgi:uncharacterized protein YndB with AHSA1/START domain
MRFERTFDRPPDQVWRALTRPDLVRAWFDELIDYDSSRLAFAEGASLLYVAKDAHLFPAQHGRVTRFDPPHLLEYTRASQVWRWQLTAAGDGASRLILTVDLDAPAGVTIDASPLLAALERLESAVMSGQLG